MVYDRKRDHLFLLIIYYKVQRKTYNLSLVSLIFRHLYLCKNSEIVLLQVIFEVFFYISLLKSKTKKHTIQKTLRVTFM